MCASYAARNVTVLDASRGNTMHSLQNTFSGCGAITGNPERARPGVRNDLNPVPAQSKAAGEAQGVGAGDKKAIVGSRMDRYVRVPALHAIFWLLIALAALIASRAYMHLSIVAAAQ